MKNDGEKPAGSSGAAPRARYDAAQTAIGTGISALSPPALSSALGSCLSILDLVPVGVVVAEDASCERVRVNEAGARMLQVPAEANLALSGSDAAPFRLTRKGQEVPSHELPIRRACATGAPVAPIEYTVVCASGARLRTLMTALPVLDAQGGVAGAVCAIVDVTHQDDVRRELEIRARQHAASAAFGMQAIREPDLEQLMSAAVKLVCEILGVGHAKVLEVLPHGESLLLRAGRGWHGVTPGKTIVPAGADSQSGYTLALGQPVIVKDLAAETRFHQPALLTSHGIVSGVSVVIEGRHGPWGVFATFSSEPRSFSREDVDFVQTVANVLAAAIERERIDWELKETHRNLALRQAELRLRRSERLASLGTLAAGITHEINNPINSILMIADHTLMSLPRKDVAPEIERALQTIREQAERCGDIVRRVLTFARLDEQEEKREEELDAVVVQAAELADKYARGAGARVSMQLRGDGAVIRCHAAELCHVVFNLIQNAIQACPKGVSIRIETRRENGWAVLVIEDDGLGIPPETIPHIFDPFFSTRRGEGSTGLGLSIAHAIVEAHDGTIDVHSVPGESTKFVLRFPLASAARMQGAASPMSESP